MTDTKTLEKPATTQEPLPPEGVTLPEAVLDEAMLPEMSEDSFLLNGVTVKITPLKIKYQKEFSKVFSPVLQGVAIDLANNQYRMTTDSLGRTQYELKGIQDFGFTDWLTAAGGLMEQVDVLPRIVQILCHNAGYMITDDELDESTMQPEEMQAVVLQFCKKRGEIEQKIADFFTVVWPTVKKEILQHLDVLKAEALKATEPVGKTKKVSSTSTV